MGALFMHDSDEVGGALKAVKEDGKPHILSVSPSYLKAGASTDVTIHVTILGTGLQGEVSLGDRVKVGRVVSRAAGKVVVRATAASDAKAGRQEVRVGDATAADALAVYCRLARVEVTPSYSIARIGGNGTSVPKVGANHRAVGFDAGKDGVPGTEDDVRLGFMPAAWTVKRFDEIAEHDHDVKHAGMMDAATGFFVPGEAGPNPERPMSANNVGNLTVVGTVKDGGERGGASGGHGTALHLLPDAVT